MCWRCLADKPPICREPVAPWGEFCWSPTALTPFLCNLFIYSFIYVLLLHLHHTQCVYIWSHWRFRTPFARVQLKSLKGFCHENALFALVCAIFAAVCVFANFCEKLSRNFTGWRVWKISVVCLSLGRLGRDWSRWNEGGRREQGGATVAKLSSFSALEEQTHLIG
jgi:hypothetical protein